MNDTQKEASKTVRRVSAEFPEYLVFYGVQYKLTIEQWGAVFTIRRLYGDNRFVAPLKRFLVGEKLALED